MQTYCTERCRSFGHHEITLQLTEASPIPDLHRVLVEYFEAAVARGTKFLPGQTIQLGWSKLRLCERSDGTLGVEERELTPETTWTESVDRALRDVWCQKEIADSVGLLDAIAFPSQDDSALVADCALDASEILMLRLDADDLPDGFSGWTVGCAREHDHGERSEVPLLAIAANLPSLVQLLALPHGSAALVLYRAASDVPSGFARIEPHVILNGKELTPKSGSYLEALQR